LSGRSRFERVALSAAYLLALPLLAYGICLSVRLAIADGRFRENTPQSVAEAVRLESGNAALHDLLAEHLESMGQNPDRERETAVRLSPFEASHWIGLGLRAEAEQDYARAEKCLLQAAKVSRAFDPQWALMNFYFRRGNTAQFAVWAKQALQISYGDPTPLFHLCWLTAADPNDIEKMLPPRREIQAQYLQYLIATKRIAYAAGIARHLAEQADMTDVPALLAYCESAITADSDAAVAVWNTLCRRKLQPFAPLVPNEGRIVTNGDFETAATARGFDWHMPQVNGVYASATHPGISVDMSGDEPEECTLMTQVLPLSPGRRYRLDYEYRGAESAVDSGLYWELANAGRDTVFARSGDLPMTGNWMTEHFVFTANDSHSATLFLRYKRASGTVRRQGAVAFRKVWAEAIP
jgi:tetratricopeptide (TPR) repeat protein